MTSLQDQVVAAIRRGAKTEVEVTRAVPGQKKRVRAALQSLILFGTLRSINGSYKLEKPNG